MESGQKVKKISKANEQIKDTIESTSFGISTSAALIMLSWGAMDLINDGVLDVLYTHPQICAASVIAPFITGYLITKFDKESDTSTNIKTLIEDVKPKSRTRKK